VTPVRRISDWLDLVGPDEAERILVTLPYAGGSGRTFRPWAQSMPAGWALATVELPGHGRRLGEPLLRRPEDVLAGLLAELPGLPPARLSVLGYSLGGWLALDLAAALVESGQRPEALAVCASRAPATGMGHPRLASLPPGPEFLTAAVDLGLAAPEMVDVPALGRAFAEVLQADLTMVETYRYRPRAPLPVPTCVLGFDEDWLTPEPSLRAWSAVSAGPLVHLRLPGPHLAVDRDAAAVGRQVWAGLDRLVGAGATRESMGVPQ
jgi:surfactin synthase thioesterase subunit